MEPAAQQPYLSTRLCPAVRKPAIKKKTQWVKEWWGVSALWETYWYVDNYRKP